MNLRDFPTFQERNKSLGKEKGVELSSIEKAFLDDEQHVHCENLIGAITVPLGVAGPLQLQGETVKGEYYVPLATTEGALVASISRGCKAITSAGGANVHICKSGATRGPVFYTSSLAKSTELYHWIKENKDLIAQTAEFTSSHLRFKKVRVRKLGNYVFVRFVFDTDEAMGMNMVTIASQKIAELIVEKCDVECLAIAGNFDIDKKPAFMNLYEGRGIKAWAEVVLSKEIIQEVLKTSSQKIFDTWLGKCMLGSAMSGSLGFNCHFANVVAAFFVATGQDLAHVVEGSHGITTTKVLENGDLYVSVYMPAVMLGTVGGGTKLKSQTEAKNLLGVQTSAELAEVLVGAVLAGEISLLASLSVGTLASSHKKLGR